MYQLSCLLCLWLSRMFNGSILSGLMNGLDRSRGLGGLEVTLATRGSFLVFSMTSQLCSCIASSLPPCHLPSLMGQQQVKTELESTQSRASSSSISDNYRSTRLGPN
jgi:hypothetical protein